MSNAEEIISLQEITESTLWGILKLEVSEEQSKFVASNAVSIAEAHFSNKAWFRGIYHGDEPVGFIMLYIDQDKAEYHLWRFMIGSSIREKALAMLRCSLLLRSLKACPMPKSWLPATYLGRVTLHLSIKSLASTKLENGMKTKK